jgi:hypothetical protein
LHTADDVLFHVLELATLEIARPAWIPAVLDRNAEVGEQFGVDSASSPRGCVVRALELEWCDLKCTTGLCAVRNLPIFSLPGGGTMMIA